MNFYPLYAITGWILIILLASILSKKYFPKQKELSRKIIHIGTGPIILLAWFFELSRVQSIATAALITIGLILNYRLRLFAAIEDIQRKSFGTIAYGISITILLVLLWPENADATSFGILSMAFGDGFAGLIGRTIKSPSWSIMGQTKSIAGTLTMGIAIAIISLIIASISNNKIEPIKILILCILGISLEQISPWGIDNLTVPIGLSLAWMWIKSHS